MLSNLALIDNPKVRELALKMKDLPYVVDIRFFPTLRDDLKELAGVNVVTYTAVTFKDNKWRRAFVIVPEEIWSNDELHQGVVDRMAANIETFISQDQPEILQQIIPAVITPEQQTTETPTPTEE